MCVCVFFCFFFLKLPLDKQRCRDDANHDTKAAVVTRAPCTNGALYVPACKAESSGGATGVKINRHAPYNYRREVKHTARLAMSLAPLETNANTR